eukprot:Nk52_evm12s78 gene=Nk52_evmTU12s78
MTWRDGDIEADEDDCVMMSAGRQAVSLATQGRCLAVCDFDSTLTEFDTTRSLVEIAARKITLDKDHADFIQQWEMIEELYKTDLSQVDYSSFHQMPTLSEFLDHAYRIENQSVERVCRKGILKGLEKGEIRESCVSDTSLVKLREGVSEFLEDLCSEINLHVLSINWSKDLIYGGLKGCVSFDRIRSNDLEYRIENEGSGCTKEISTGQICQHVSGASGKLQVFRAIVDSFKLNVGSGERASWQYPVTIFVGDSITDALALQEADVGIIIGHNEVLRNALKHYGIGCLDYCHFERASAIHMEEIKNHTTSLIFEAPELDPFGFVRKVVRTFSS